MKKEAIEIFLKFLNKWLFPDFTNKLTWAVATAGILIITTPIEFRVAICNWLISAFNITSISPWEVPLVEERNDVMGYFLIFSALLHNAIYKIISYKLDSLTFEIKREKRKVDLELYNKFIALLPSSGETALMLKDTDFAGPIRRVSMNSIDEFMYYWNGAEFKFNNEVIEAKKDELYKSMTEFRYMVCQCTTPKGKEFLTVYPSRIDPEFDPVPSNIRNEIKTLNELASGLYQQHQEFITFCKKNL